MRALPEGDRQRTEVLRLLTNWRVTIESNPELAQQEGDLQMALSPAFLEWEEKTKQDSRAEGRAEGKREVALKMLSAGVSIEQIVQFTELSREQIQQLQQESDRS